MLAEVPAGTPSVDSPHMLQAVCVHRSSAAVAPVLVANAYRSASRYVTWCLHCGVTPPAVGMWGSAHLCVLAADWLWQLSVSV
jgi:hypothetical protein